MSWGLVKIAGSGGSAVGNFANVHRPGGCVAILSAEDSLKSGSAAIHGPGLNV